MSAGSKKKEPPTHTNGYERTAEAARPHARFCQLGAWASGERPIVRQGVFVSVRVGSWFESSKTPLVPIIRDRRADTPHPALTRHLLPQGEKGRRGRQGCHDDRHFAGGATNCAWNSLKVAGIA